MIRILVDSSSDYSLEELSSRNFSLIPLNIIMGEKSYHDCLDLTRRDVYEYMINSDDVPTTSQPSPQDFIHEFELAKEQGDELICILISSALSGTFQSAAIAKSIVDYDGIYLIDSLTTTHAIRIMAEYANQLIQEGAGAADIVNKVEALRSRLRICAAVDTLEYLCKGGRVSKAAASVGELAGIKPIVSLTPEGTVGVIGKCLGKTKAINYILKYVQEHPINTDFPFYTLFSYEAENCIRMEEKLALQGYTPSLRVELGATIGVHVGPGAFAVIYVE